MQRVLIIETFCKLICFHEKVQFSTQKAKHWNCHIILRVPLVNSRTISFCHIRENDDLLREIVQIFELFELFEYLRE